MHQTHNSHIQSHTVTYSHYSHYSHCDYSHFSVSLQSPQYSNYSRKRRSTPTTTAPSLCRASLTRAPIGSMAGWTRCTPRCRSLGASCWLLLSWHGLAVAGCQDMPRCHRYRSSEKVAEDLPERTIKCEVCDVWSMMEHVEHPWFIPGAVKNNLIMAVSSYKPENND